MSDIGWIRLNVEVPHHAKFVRLANELGVREVWPRVVQLWCWAANSARNGDLSGLKDTQIARESGWKGSATRFVTALRSCGFIDPDNRIHDWDDEQGKMLESREKERDRKRAARAAKAALSRGQSASASADASRVRARGRVNETGRDGTEEQEQDPSPAVAAEPSNGPQVGPPKTLFGDDPRSAVRAVPAILTKPPRARNPALDEIGLRYRRAFGLGDGFHSWTTAEAVQAAAALKRWDVATIVGALEAFARSPRDYDRTQTLAAMLTPARLEVALRKPAGSSGPVPAPAADVEWIQERYRDQEAARARAAAANANGGSKP